MRVSGRKHRTIGQGTLPFAAPRRGLFALRLGRRRAGRTLPSTALMPYNPVALALRPARRGFRWQWLAIACGVAVVAVGLTLGALALFAMPRMVEGQELVFDGRVLGVTANADEARDALTAIQDDLKTTYGMEVELKQELTFQPVVVNKRNLLTPKQTTKALRDNIDVDVVASVVTVNDRPAVALRTSAEAQQALDSILQPFRDVPEGRERADIGFVEDVKVEEMTTDYALVCDAAEAARSLQLGAGVEDNWYTVEKGDSLSRIAKKFGLKVSDLRKANPEVASTDVIQPDQQINAIKPNRWLNVRFTDTVTREESLPFETVEKKSADLYTTQKQVTQEGKDGKRQVVARVTYINGMESVSEIVSQTVLTKATDQIVLRGTKKVPTSDDGGTTTSGKFIVPVKNYRLTSTFKVRTLGGVTRWHYGVDLACPTGTPVYASRDGTVSFSGSSSGYGLLVKINHGDSIETRYGHNSKLLVKKGQKVKQGQIIALVGSTGHSTGPHCHFEIRINGKPVNPEKYVKVR